MRLKQIANIIFEYPLYIKEANQSTFISSEIKKTINGSVVIYEQYNKKQAKTLTAQSLDNAWVNKQTLDKLIKLANESFGKSYIAILSNNITKSVKFNHESFAVVFEPLFEGSNYYKGNINLIEN